MHILHITNSYGGTEVYKNLYTQLDNLAIQQTIYVPLNAQNRERVGNHMIAFKTQGSKIVYSTVLQKRHRYFYMAKINRIVADICQTIDISSVDAIHASTLCVDGGAAYKLHLRYNIPFIVAIRNTDVNDYYRVFVWRKWYFSKILNSASKIIFISPKYKEFFLEKVIPLKIAATIQNKIEVIPNGIEPYFLRNRQFNHKEIGDKIQLLFISAFKKGKGLIETILSVDQLRADGYNVTLRAIGKGLPNRSMDAEYMNKVEQLTLDRPWIYLEEFKRPPELCDALLNADIFVMPSKPETFGLVYVEALSQDVPIIYTKGEGFDGFFPDGVVGYPAEAGDASNIKKQIENVIKNYKKLTSNISKINLHEFFDWAMIAKRYENIYNKLRS